MCRISEQLSKGMQPHKLFRLPTQSISEKILKKLLQKSSDLLFVVKLSQPSVSLTAGVFISGGCQTRQVTALQCPWAFYLSCPLSSERDQMMSGCLRQPRFTQDSILWLSGEAPELAAELKMEKSLANKENLHNY